VSSAHAKGTGEFYALPDGSGLCYDSKPAATYHVQPPPGIPDCGFFVAMQGLNDEDPPQGPTGVTTEHQLPRQRHTSLPRQSVIPPNAARKIACVRRADGDVDKLARC
jgi:hypothetical protein